MTLGMYKHRLLCIPPTGSDREGFLLGAILRGIVISGVLLPMIDPRLFLELGGILI